MDIDIKISGIGIGTDRYIYIYIYIGIDTELNTNIAYEIGVYGLRKAGPGWLSGRSRAFCRYVRVLPLYGTFGVVMRAT